MEHNNNSTNADVPFKALELKSMTSSKAAFIKNDTQVRNEKKEEMEDKEFEIKPIMTAKELYEMNISEIPMLVESLIPKYGVVGLAGSSDCGKSTFLRQLSLSIVMGDQHFLGMPLNAEHKRVIYITTEDGQYAWSSLLRKQLPIGADLNNLNKLTVVFDSEQPLTTLKTLLDNAPQDLVIIDAFGDIFSGELNKMNIVRTFIQDYYDLCRKYKCALIFLHHTNKNSEDNPPDKRNLVGSQGMEAKMRVVIELRRDPSKMSLRHMCIVKGNYIPDELKQNSLELSMDERLVFSPTGRQVPFNSLIKRPYDKLEEEKKTRIIALHNEGKSIREIEKILKEEGFTGVSKSTIAKHVKVVQLSTDTKESKTGQPVN